MVNDNFDGIFKKFEISYKFNEDGFVIGNAKIYK